ATLCHAPHATLTLPADTVGRHVRFKRVELLVEFLNLFLEQVAHGHDRLRAALFVHHGQMSNVLLDHDSQGFIATSAHRYRMHTSRHDFFYCRLFWVSVL